MTKYHVSEHLFGLPGLSNVGLISPVIYRGAQPTEEGFKTLKEMGIKTIIALRVLDGEKETVESLGMKYIPLSMTTFKNVNINTVRRAISLMIDPANQPVFLHCQHGADRTGIVSAVYRMEIDGWSEVEAEEDMQNFGFHDIWFQFKSFIRLYRPTMNNAKVE